MHEDDCSSASLDRRCYAATAAGKGPCSRSIAESLRSERNDDGVDRSAGGTMKSETPTVHYKHHVTRSRNAGSLETTREKGWFLSDRSFDFPPSFSFHRFRNSDSPRNVVDRYVISPRERLATTPTETPSFYRRVRNKRRGPRSIPRERRCTTVADLSRPRSRAR